jgi:hypothetical protein
LLSPSRRTATLGVMVLLAALLITAQDVVAVKEALDRAAIHLEAAAGKSPGLALWTLRSVGRKANEPVVDALLREVLTAEPGSTREAALGAMVLSDLDPERYRNRIASCACFLVDNQAKDGLWGPGQRVEPPELFAEPKGRGLRPAPLKISRRAEGPARGDPANSVWAAFGLQACREAGLVIPQETLASAGRAWGVETLPAADALCGLVVYDRMAGRDWQKNPEVRKALARLASAPPALEPRALWVLGRAMRLTESEKLVGADWYREGARSLLGTHRADGSWGGIDDTSYAMLFLRNR